MKGKGENCIVEARNHYNLGNKYRGMEKYEEAITHYTNSIQLNPFNADAFNRLGLTYYAMNNYEAAITNYKQAIKLEPSNAVYHRNLGRAYRMMEKYEEAITHFSNSTQLDPSNANAFNGLGLTYYAMNEYAAAITNFTHAIELEPSNAVYHHNLGDAYNVTKRYDEAMKKYETAERLSIQRRQCIFSIKKRIAIVWIRKRAYQKGMEIIRSASLRNDNQIDDGELDDAKHWEGVALYKLAQYTDAIDLLRSSLQSSDEWIKCSIYYYIARCMRKTNANEEEVKEMLDKSIECNSTRSKAYYQRAQLSILPLDKALSDYQSALDNNPQNMPVHQLSDRKIELIHSNIEKIKKQMQRHMGSAEGFDQVQYMGVIDILKGCSTSKSCPQHLLIDLPNVLEGLGDIQFIVSEATQIAQSRLDRLKKGVVRLSVDEAIAIAAYTFDLCFHSSSENLYHTLNNVLRNRNPISIQKLKGYLYYLMSGLSKLPPVEAIVYRGIPSSHLDTVRDRYIIGTKVHWSAFTSTTTDLATVQGFAGPSGIIFRIQVFSGRNIVEYSALPYESEVLLSPNFRLFVSKAIHQENDGYYYVDLVEVRDSTLVF